MTINYDYIKLEALKCAYQKSGIVRQKGLFE